MSSTTLSPFLTDAEIAAMPVIVESPEYSHTKGTIYVSIPYFQARGKMVYKAQGVGVAHASMAWWVAHFKKVNPDCDVRVCPIWLGDRINADGSQFSAC